MYMYIGLFRLIARDESITLHQLADFLEHLIQVDNNHLYNICIMCMICKLQYVNYSNY